MSKSDFKKSPLKIEIAQSQKDIKFSDTPSAKGMQMQVGILPLPTTEVQTNAIPVQYISMPMNFEN